MRAATRGRLTCHQPRRGRRMGLGGVSGVHGHVEPGPAIVAGRVAALFGGREAVPQNFCDPAGSLGGCGDDTDLGYPCRRHRFCRSHASLSVRRGAHGVRRRLTPTAASHGTLASSPPSSCCPRRVADVRRDDPSRPTAGLRAPARHRCSGKLASLSFPPGGTTAKGSGRNIPVCSPYSGRRSTKPTHDQAFVEAARCPYRLRGSERAKRSSSGAGAHRVMRGGAPPTR